jgi:hypothetical protein
MIGCTRKRFFGKRPSVKTALPSWPYPSVDKISLTNKNDKKMKGAETSKNESSVPIESLGLEQKPTFAYTAKRRNLPGDIQSSLTG